MRTSSAGRWARVAVLALIAAGCAEVGSQPVPNSGGAAETTAAETPVSVGISSTDETNSVLTWKIQLENVGEKQGMEVALKLLDELMDKYPQAAINCHSLARHIGFSLAGKADLVSPMDSNCDYGLVHGQLYGLAETSESMGSFAEAAVPYCASAPSSWSESAICYHGVGHGFAITSNNDIKEALKGCAGLDGEYTDQCYGAVLMEFGEDRLVERGWPSGHSSENSPKVLKVLDKDIDSLCDGLPSSCYYRLWMYHAPTRSEAGPPDEAELAEQVCSAVLGEEDRKLCLRGFGEFAATLWIMYDLNYEYPPDTPGAAEAAAKLGADRCGRHADPEACLFGLITSTVGGLYNSNWPYIPDFCAEVPRDLVDSCKRSVQVAINGGEESGIP